MKQTSVTIMEKVAQHRNIIALEDVSTTNTSITRTSIDPPVVDATTSLSTSNKLFLQDFIPVLQDQLYFGTQTTATGVTSGSTSTTSGTPSIVAQVEVNEYQLFCIDDELIYARFFADFGPLNLGQTMRFCQQLDKLLTSFSSSSSSSDTPNNYMKPVLLYTSDHPHKRTNAMTLLVLYLVMRKKYTPSQALAPLLKHVKKDNLPFGFRDAASGLCTFCLTLVDCVKGLYQAQRHGFFDYDTFDLTQYEYYDMLTHGDINWIVPNQICAMSGPLMERLPLGSGGFTMVASEYAQVLKHKFHISCVIRFNEASTYDARCFTSVGIRHLEMEYQDGSNPPDHILHQFLQVCDREIANGGAIAVHCKAGLGRTGTNIGAYLMSKFHFTAREAIAWLRICRPGSVVGPQQHYLVAKENFLHSYWKNHPRVSSSALAFQKLNKGVRTFNPKIQVR